MTSLPLEDRLKEYYSSGNLALDVSFVGSLNPDSYISDFDSFRKDWDSLTNIKNLVYSFETIETAVSLDLVDDPELKDSVNKLLDLRLMIKDYDNSLRQSINKVINNARVLINNYDFNKDDISALVNARNELFSSLKAATLINYLKPQQDASDLLSLYDETINKFNSNIERVEKNLFKLNTDSFLLAAREALSSRSVSDKKKFFSELKKLPLDYEGFSDEQRKEVSSLLSSYESFFSKRNGEVRKKRKSFAKKFFAISVASCIIGLGVYSFSDAKRILDYKIAEFSNSFANKKIERSIAERKEAINYFNSLIAGLSSSADSLRQVNSSLSKQNDSLIARKNSLERAVAFLTRRVYEKNVELKKLNNSVSNNETIISNGLRSASLIHKRLSDDYLKSKFSGLLKNHAVVYVDKSANLTYLIDKNFFGTKVRGVFMHTDALDPRPKTRAGQKRTPEGVYDVAKSFFTRNYHSFVYGNGFIKINYPTPEQVKKGFSGGGVLLVSSPDDDVEKAIINGRDVMNVGVAYLPSDFKRVYDFVKHHDDVKIVIDDDSKRPLYFKE